MSQMRIVSVALALLLLATPAVAAEEPCFITKRVPVDWSRAQPPLPKDGSRVRPSNTPELKAGYSQWLGGWRNRMAAQSEVVRKEEVPCPGVSPLARWQLPEEPIPPGGLVVMIPHPDYPPDMRRWDLVPDEIPVPAPGPLTVIGGLLVLVLARVWPLQSDRRGRVE